MHHQRWLRFGAVVLLVALADLSTKIWASATLQGSDVDVPGPLDLRLSHNSGIAFGGFDNLPPLMIVVLTAAVAAAVFIAGARGAAPFVPCALITGGAIGNVIDRLEAGSVVDMLHTSFWPTFNLADVFITSGVVVWVLYAAGREPEASEHADASR